MKSQKLTIFASSKYRSKYFRLPDRACFTILHFHEGSVGPVAATVDVAGMSTLLEDTVMEMKSSFGSNSMFNFDVLRARTHELDMIKEPSLEVLTSDEWETYVRGIVQDGLAVGSESYSTDLGEWCE